MDDLAAFILDPLMIDCIQPILAHSSVASGGTCITSRAESIFTVASNLQWAMQQTNPKFLADHWPGLLSILLRLIDNPEPRFRIKGLQILRCFLCKCPQRILTTTGIRKVFEDAVYPSLYFISGSVKEQEPAILLSEAYSVLLRLADGGQAIEEKRHSLDRIIRDGIVTVYRHASDNPVAVQILMRNLAMTVSELGIHAVKHIQNILCLIESVTMESSVISRSSTVMAALEVLNAVLICCWPRFTEVSYADQAIRIAIVSWIALGDQEALDSSATEEQRSAVLPTLVSTLRLIKNIAQGHNHEARADTMSDMLSREPRMASLLNSVG
ncbi:hypothetical protein CP532_6878 [Ophiocordyceps camponoti-leonardi (nom. inval.)]|nr:hypothetical protein CP532_6878 [Ophiocordyceps camponoti-leonardi (nom. inval.)]